MRRPAGGAAAADVGGPAEARSFHDQFVQLFNDNYHRLSRVMDRLSGDPELAADLVQEAFVQLFKRGSMPDAPESWLITVALNRFRNARASRSRRLRLLTPARAAGVHSDPAPSPLHTAGAAETRERVRRVLDRLPEREQKLLLLQAEGYRYRDIAAALELNENSVGVLLQRARRAFRDLYQRSTDAS
jgi:RNA polymerase sigma-70 factor (ECF subfamily)